MARKILECYLFGHSGKKLKVGCYKISKYVYKVLRMTFVGDSCRKTLKDKIICALSGKKIPRMTWNVIRG